MTPTTPVIPTEVEERSRGDARDVDEARRVSERERANQSRGITDDTATGSFACAKFTLSERSESNGLRSG